MNYLTKQKEYLYFCIFTDNFNSYKFNLFFIDQEEQKLKIEQTPPFLVF